MEIVRETDKQIIKFIINMVNKLNLIYTANSRFLYPIESNYYSEIKNLFKCEEDLHLFLRKYSDIFSLYGIEHTYIPSVCRFRYRGILVSVRIN